MKMGWMLGVLVLVSAGSAFAQDGVDSVLFNCRFKGANKGLEFCQARGIVKFEARSSEESQGRLQIVCDGQVVYHDGLIYRDEEHVIKIAGKPLHGDAKFPVIAIMKPHQLPATETAFLYMDDAYLRGFCDLKPHDFDQQ